MENMTAFCGIKCLECPAFIAHKNDDQELRVKTAREWSKMFKSDLKPEDINCVGCTATQGVHVGFCSVCEIRACGLGKGVANCGLCADYACGRLVKFFEMAPAAKKLWMKSERSCSERSNRAGENVDSFTISTI